MFTITTPKYNLSYPNGNSALILPTGYRDYPDAFDSSAVAIISYLKGHQFDIDILSSPDEFYTVELNSNLIRLGKFAVKSVAIPFFISLMANYVSNQCSANQAVDEQPVKVSMCVEICDTNSMKVQRHIEFEGTAEDFNEMAENIKTLTGELK